MLVLPNGLKCLLIHDPSSEMICGVVAVNCGAFNDPPNALGLAHLTEHMILRGSKTYNSGDLGLKLREVGGQLNAYTTGDQSCFYFEVSTFANDIIGNGKSFVESVLPVFSSYLTCPLLSEKHVSMEIKAVDDEHNGNRNEHDKVLFHAYRLLANPDHAFSRFGTGNHKSLSLLSKKKLKSLSRVYFKNNFIPQNMSLVLKGPQTILQLKKMVLSNFMSMGMTKKGSPVSPNRCSQTGSEPTEYLQGKDVPIFKCDGPNTIVIKGPFPSKIRVCFPVYLMNHMANYNAAVRALCNLLGEEGPRSLSSLLNAEKGWVSSLFVFVQTLYSDIQMLVVDLEPTKAAWSHIGDIVQEIISYARLNIGDSNDVDLNFLVAHYSGIDEYNFKSQPANESLLDDVLDYAERMNRSFADAMDANFISSLATWNEISTASLNIKDMLNGCFAESMVKVLFLIPPDMSVEQVIVTQVREEKYFGFEFGISRLEFGRCSRFDFLKNKLPSPKTEFVEKLSMKFKSPIAYHKVRGILSQQLDPNLTSYDQSHEIWMSPPSSLDNETQEVIVTAVLKFPKIGPTATNSVILDLLIELAGYALRGCLYELEKVGSFWGIFSNINKVSSIMVTTCGTQEAVESMLTQIFKSIRDTAQKLHQIQYRQLKKARVSLRNRYEDQEKCHNIKKVLSVAYVLLEECLITPNEKIEALEQIDDEHLRHFTSFLLTTVEYTSLLLSGELGKSCMDSIYIVGKNCGFDRDMQDPSSILVKQGSFYVYDTETTEEDNISVVMHYTQIGARTDARSFALAKLYLFVLSTNALDELRVKRQLSYSVYSGIRMFRRVFGIYLLIPSAWHECTYLTDQTEEFLNVVEEMVCSCTEEEFQDTILNPFIESIEQSVSDNESGSGLFAALQPQKGSGAKPLTPRFCEHWNHVNQVLNSTYNFKSKNCEEPCHPDVIRGLEKEEFLLFVRQHMSLASAQRSVVVICSHPFKGIDHQRKKIIAHHLFQKMKKIGLNVNEDQVLDALLQIENAEAFGEAILILKKSFSSQRMKFKRLQLEVKIGGLVSSFGDSLCKLLSSKDQKSCRDACVLPRVNLSDYHQLHREGSIASSVLLSEKFEKLLQIEGDQNELIGLY